MYRRWVREGERELRLLSQRRGDGGTVRERGILSMRVLAGERERERG